MAELSESELHAIEQRANEATPGPWENAGCTVTNWPSGSPQPDELAEIVANGEYSTWRADAAFIAAARTDVPALVVEVRYLRSAFKEADDARDVVLRENAELRERVAKLEAKSALLHTGLGEVLDEVEGIECAITSARRAWDALRDSDG